MAQLNTNNYQNPYYPSQYSNQPQYNQVGNTQQQNTQKINEEINLVEYQIKDLSKWFIFWNAFVVILVILSLILLIIFEAKIDNIIQQVVILIVDGIQFLLAYFGVKNKKQNFLKAYQIIAAVSIFLTIINFIVILAFAIDQIVEAIAPTIVLILFQLWLFKRAYVLRTLMINLQGQTQQLSMPPQQQQKQQQQEQQQEQQQQYEELYVKQQ